MRPIIFLLCLLLVAALRGVIGSDDAPTTTEQNDAILSKTHVTLEAVNTGCNATPDGASIRTEDTAWITHELVRAVIDVPTLSQYGPLPIELASGIGIYRDRRRQEDQKSPSSLGSGTDRPRRTYL
jgi:hypothetical protein